LDNQKISFEDFKNIIVERLGCEPEQVTMDASFQEDLNADSLDLVELIYAFEENTGLEIPDEDAERSSRYPPEASTICSNASGSRSATPAFSARLSPTAPSPTRARTSRRATTSAWSTWETRSSS
jgi:acyl carrier protein